jgi:hypothetical protein
MKFVKSYINVFLIKYKKSIVSMGKYYNHRAKAHEDQLTRVRIEFSVIVWSVHWKLNWEIKDIKIYYRILFGGTVF